MAKFSNYYKILTPQANTTAMTDSQGIGDQGAYSNNTWYQRLIQGSASRITRYREYDLMDNDIEIARSLDTIAEEMIGSDPNIDLPLDLNIISEKAESIHPNTVLTLKTTLHYWCDMHDWYTRLFKVARQTIKYGDCFFIRRSETRRWEYLHPKLVVAAIVDEHDMTKVVGWQVRKESRTPNSPYNQPVGQFGSHYHSTDDLEIIPADDMIVFTLNDDMSDSAPFGDSILRAVYRAQKQKELLEDAILIYRIQRAPERRVFYVDVGKMPPQRVKAYLESIKNEMRQRKIPTAGGGTDQVDSVYNPQSMQEDIFLAQRPDGKGSRVETLPGGNSTGEIGDLSYFQEKVFRGLRIPVSYMMEGSEGSSINGGKVGTAYIQELRFAMYIRRLQGYVARVIDREFKRYLKHAGIHVDHSIFKISLPEPENFGTYRTQELDSALLNTFRDAADVEYLSPRFIMKRYLQLTDEEIITNEKLRREELGLSEDSDKDLKTLYGSGDEDFGGGSGGGGLGMTAGLDGMDFDADGDDSEEDAPEMETPEELQP